jgi:hypothetical protein
MFSAEKSNREGTVRDMAVQNEHSTRPSPVGSSINASEFLKPDSEIGDKASVGSLWKRSSYLLTR